MEIDADETRLNIVERYGSVLAFTSLFGVKSRRALDYVLTGSRQRPSTRVSKGKLMLRRLRAEGLLVVREEEKAANA